MDPYIQKKISVAFEPNCTTILKIRGKDVAVKSDAEGNAAFAFIGKLTEKGTVKGERFARILVKDNNGNIIKDHWDLKGKASRCLVLNRISFLLHIRSNLPAP